MCGTCVLCPLWLSVVASLPASSCAVGGVAQRCATQPAGAVSLGAAPAAGDPDRRWDAGTVASPAPRARAEAASGRRAADEL